MAHKIERKRVINTYTLTCTHKNSFMTHYIGEVGMITKNICFVSHNIDEKRDMFYGS